MTLPTVGVGLTAALGHRTSARIPARLQPRWRADAVAVAVLVLLPVLVYGVPALLGHPVLPGDDLTQNYPLRALAGHEIRAGQLPLFDPYTWSGAPLLAGWNAGAAYPFILLFAVLPGAAAWSVSLIITWAVAGLGLFAFLRGLRLGPGPALLGAATFAFAGAMSAQVAHFGLVTGLSWVPVALLGVLRLTQEIGPAARLRWTAALAAAVGLIILAGEPRAMDDAAVILGLYAVWRAARLGRAWAPAALSVAAGLALGIAVGAVQWLPGLAAVSTSQRGAATVALFNSGSLPHKWLLLLLVPDLLGGSGSFGQPAFAASYNLAEVTGYVGILPLVAAFMLAGRLRWADLRGPGRLARLPEWLVWHGVAVAGVGLALGGNTPLGRVLVHLPLFGDQRLQSRNVLITDLALAVLLGYWADATARAPGRLPWLRWPGRGPGPRWRWPGRETVLGALPPLGVLAVIALALAWGAGFFRWLGLAAGTASAVTGRLEPWLLPSAVLAAGALAFVVAGRHAPPRLRSRLLGGLVLADLVVFTLLSVVAVLPGLGGGHHAATSRRRQAANLVLLGRAGHPPRARPVATLGYGGRFAVYDPGELDAEDLTDLDPPDLNVLAATASVQGYSSLVDGGYAAATGSHRATGDGQDVLSPQAVGDGVLDQLGTSVLLTPPGYLITAAGQPSPAAPGPAGTGRREVAAGQLATWYLGNALAVSSVQVPVAGPAAVAATGLRLGLLTPGGAVRWLAATARPGTGLAARLPRPVTAVAVVARPGAGRAALGPVSVTDAAGTAFRADGQLQDALTPARWRYAGRDGSFAVFADQLARPPLTLAPPGYSASGVRPAPAPAPAPAGAWVRALAGPAAGPTAAAVRSRHGVTVIRSVAAIPGWSAVWQPRHGLAVALPVRADGLVQAVTVPPGRGVLSWRYLSPGFTAGWWLSAGAGVAVLVLLGVAFGHRVGRPREVLTAL
jgi:hypothetical protein